MESPARIGILGGTFNPIHNGHLLVAGDVAAQLSLRMVLFIPARIPPHKDSSEITSPRMRLEMVRLAIRGRDTFELSMVELEREGKSYTVETLGELRRIFSSPSEFYLIIGADNLMELHTWKDPERIVELATVVVMTRPGFAVERPRFPWMRDFLYLNVAPVPVSSTGVREKVRNGEDFSGMVPPVVREYILKNNLYRGASCKTRLRREAERKSPEQG